VELEVGGVITSRISPVLLEPLVPADSRPGHGPQPMSPDWRGGCPDMAKGRVPSRAPPSY
jgi:hypothetical protein